MGVEVTVEFVEAFGNAWNNHDINELILIHIDLLYLLLYFICVYFLY